MGLRILGACVAAFLTAYALKRHREHRLRRGEMVAVVFVATALAIASATPDLFDPLLSALGFEPGGERRIIGLLVISNLFTLGLVFRGFSRIDVVSDEVGELVDALALARMREEPLRLPGGCAVVIPAFNEADNIPGVLATMPQTVAGMVVQAIVVADGCTDATEAAARRNGAVVIGRDLRRGSGAAVRLGYRCAIEAGARIIVTLDADGQHDPREMDRLVAPLLEGRADMVQGSRALGSFEVESRVRRHGVSAFARLLSLLGRAPITDPSTGYRAITATGLARLDLRQDQFYVSELILEALRKRLKVVEVPINLRRRNGGSTKKPPALRYAWGFSKAIVRTWLR